MNDEDRFRSIGLGCFIILIIILVALIISLNGCKTVEVTKEVPVVAEHTTVQHHTDIVRDTLMMRDSIYHYVMGDTVIIERWHQAININRVVVADTIRDTIPKVVTVTVTKYVEKSKPPWYRRVTESACVGMLVLILVALRKPIYALIKKI